MRGQHLHVRNRTLLPHPRISRHAPQPAGCGPFAGDVPRQLLRRLRRRDRSGALGVRGLRKSPLQTSLGGWCWWAFLLGGTVSAKSWTGVSGAAPASGVAHLCGLGFGPSRPGGRDPADDSSPQRAVSPVDPQAHEGGRHHGRRRDFLTGTGGCPGDPQRRPQLAAHRRCRSQRWVHASIYEFDDTFTGPHNGFADAEDYYARCSVEGVLDRIETPLLRVIHARNDAWISSSWPTRTSAATPCPTSPWP